MMGPGPHLQKPSNGPAERNNGIFDDHLSIPYINSELFLDKRNYLNILKRFKHKLGLVQTNRSLKTETLLRYKTYKEYKDPMGIHSGKGAPSFTSDETEGRSLMPKAGLKEIDRRSIKCIWY